MTSGPVTCVYRAYEHGELVATGRLILDDLPSVGDEVALNGRQHVVREPYGEGAVTDRPSHPVCCSGAHVTGGEHSWTDRL